MTNKEKLALNREVAELLEPIPTWARGLRDGRDARSDLGCWWIEDHHIGTRQEHSERHAMNFTDEWQSAGMLYEMMPSPQVRIHGASERVSTCQPEFKGKLGPFSDSDPKVAITLAARAWLLAKFKA